MASSATLTTLTDRVEQLLLDTLNVVFPAALVNEGIRLALGEYNLYRPQTLFNNVTPTSGTREVSLSTLTGLLDVLKVWFPYLSTDHPPKWVEWELWWDAGVPKVFLDLATAPTGSQIARVYYTKLHTLNGLDSATATTYPELDDGMLILGGAGYSCLARSIDLAETAANMAVSTPNYAALAEAFLGQFRLLLGGVGT